MFKQVFFPQPYLKPFPDPQAVFAEPVERYAKHLHPLASIDLSVINPGWSGDIHMVAPMEPCDGCIGDDAEAFYTDYLQRNWLGFRLNDAHRYELCGDFQFFLVERADASEAAREELLEHYEEQGQTFAAARANFRERQELNSIGFDGTPNPRIKHPAFDQIGGGVSSYAFNYSRGIALDESDNQNIVPVTPDGRRFHFIASVPEWNYGCGGGVIFLFFEPESRIALFTFYYD